ncbi:MAG: hypothetical protein IJV04_02030 [Lachnospiraceae bacterium]|nr:hypothetical protein [Lachnospiraceae bacterium]
MDSVIKWRIHGLIEGYNQNYDPDNVDPCMLPIPFVSTSAASNAKDAVREVRHSLSKIGLVMYSDRVDVYPTDDSRRVQENSDRIRTRMRN